MAERQLRGMIAHYAGGTAGPVPATRSGRQALRQAGRGADLRVTMRPGLGGPAAPPGLGLCQWAAVSSTMGAPRVWTCPARFRVQVVHRQVVRWGRSASGIRPFAQSRVNQGSVPGEVSGNSRVRTAAGSSGGGDQGWFRPWVMS